MRRIRSGKRRWAVGILATLALLGSVSLHAQEKLRKSLVDDEVAAHWIYDDFPRAVAESKTSGKPILALLRCVP